MYFVYGIVFIIVFLYAVKINYDKVPSFKEELKLYWGKSCYHIHHWITYTLFILLILLGKTHINYIINTLIAIFLGFICEDFLYRNIFQLRIHC